MTTHTTTLGVHNVDRQDAEQATQDAREVFKILEDFSNGNQDLDLADILDLEATAKTVKRFTKLMILELNDKMKLSDGVANADQEDDELARDTANIVYQLLNDCVKGEETLTSERIRSLNEDCEHIQTYLGWKLKQLTKQKIAELNRSNKPDNKEDVFTLSISKVGSTPKPRDIVSVSVNAMDAFWHLKRRYEAKEFELGHTKSHFQAQQSDFTQLYRNGNFQMIATSQNNVFTISRCKLESDVTDSVFS